jgi:D-threo-aldose 1-dehydrogenase
MSGLRSRPLGRTGLRVSALCAGTSGLGSIPEIFGYEVPEERALARGAGRGAA